MEYIYKYTCHVWKQGTNTKAMQKPNIFISILWSRSSSK